MTGKKIIAAKLIALSTVLAGGGGSVYCYTAGVKPWTLTGWSIRDVTGYKFAFPEGFTVQPGDTVTIHTGSGKNRPLHLYWGQGSYVWNNTGDKVTFKNSSGKVVDTCAYAGDGSYVTC